MKISQEVLKVLERSEIGGTVAGTTLVLPEQLDRKLYQDVNKVLECLGGKWNRKSKAHLFQENVVDMIENAMITGEVTDAKKEFQFFETPKAVVAKMLELADIRPGMVVLEPSAGLGAIARQIQFKHPKANLECVELWEKNYSNLSRDGFLIVGKNFLEFRPRVFANGHSVYDRIVANPPFTRQQDVDHVLHMYDCLKPGGRIVTIMSPSWTFRENKKSQHFRDQLKEWGAKTEELPAGTFSESGTEIRTMLVVIDKKE